MKTCRDCGVSKVLDDFYASKGCRDGHRPECKACNLAARRGLTLETFDALLASQGGGCAICGNPDADNVDLDHVTGRVRGILCFNCNVAVGQMGDDEDRRAAAMAYVARDEELCELARDRVLALAS